MKFKMIVFLSTICMGTLFGAQLYSQGNFNYKIVLPDQPLPVEAWAAQELADHLEKATGKKISMDKSAPGKPILIGRAAKLNQKWDAPNGGTIRIGDDAIVLAGKDDGKPALDFSGNAGTLIAVYDFLADELGVRWFWPGEDGTVVPRKEQISLKNGERDSRTLFEFARWRQVQPTASTWSSPQNRDRFFRNEAIWLRRHGFSETKNLNYGHAFAQYFNRYGKEFPEIFNLLPDGTRIPDKTLLGGRPDLVSMCVSSPRLTELILKEWNGKGLLNLNENDSAGKCVCPNCMAMDNNDDPGRLAEAKKQFDLKQTEWYAPLGSLSDRYARFILNVQAEADKTHPGHEIIGLIYANYSQPPTAEIKLNDRILMRYCPPVMYPWSKEKVQQAQDVWQGWSDAGAKLMFRPNFTWDGHNFPLNYYPEFVGLYDFAMERKLDSIDMDALTGSYGGNPLTHYVIADRIDNGGKKSLAELEDEFFAAFGKGAPEVREYFKLMRQATEKGNEIFGRSDRIEGGDFASFFISAPLLFTPELMKQAQLCLDRAAMAAKGDDAALARIDFIRTGFDDCMLVLAAQEGFRTYKETGNAGNFSKNVKKLKQFREKNEHKGYVNIGHVEHMENRIWPKYLSQVADGDRMIDGWLIVFDDQKVGDQAGWQGKIPADSVSIGTDSHWERQPAGLAWEAKNGKQFKGVSWYYSRIIPTESELKEPQMLKFGAVDGKANVYLNGELIFERAQNDQGDPDAWKKPFDVQIPAGKLKEGENLLTIRVEKYAGISGIWRPVYFSNGLVAAKTANTLNDGRFESGSFNIWKRDVRNGVFDFAIENNPDRFGEKLLMIDCRETDASPRKSWGRVLQTVKVKPGQKYRLTVQYKTGNDFKGNFEVWLRSGLKSGLSEANKNIGGLGTSGNWGKLTTEFTPESSECIVYLNVVNGTGAVKISDVTLTEVK